MTQIVLLLGYAVLGQVFSVKQKHTVRAPDQYDEIEFITHTSILSVFISVGVR